MTKLRRPRSSDRVGQNHPFGPRCSTSHVATPLNGETTRNGNNAKLGFCPSQKPKLDASLIGLCRCPSFEEVRNALSGSRSPVCLMVTFRRAELGTNCTWI